MTDIARARTILAKWRGASPDAPWLVDREHSEFDGATVGNDAFLNPTEENELKPILDISGISIGTARLIVGTAGNPDLLDAIDAELAAAVQFPEAHNTIAKRIAAAIISADERMSA
ncbi:hypothetical protein [Curtobacterium sp. USHLN213]|uniref:hypothetical protein n=1 Tax=Curtobacterium sp. USHLN213 TaxID=3081255 RepID=UPI003017F1AF